MKVCIHHIKAIMRVKHKLWRGAFWTYYHGSHEIDPQLEGSNIDRIRKISLQCLPLFLNWTDESALSIEELGGFEETAMIDHEVRFNSVEVLELLASRFKLLYYFFPHSILFS
jgi:hypothetical protein